VWIKASVSLLALLVVNSAPAEAECGINKPFKIYVQESFHADRVAAPMAGCKTKEGPCKTPGTIFIVSAKKVKYAILLLDGLKGKLQVGESYSAILLCQKSPMMIPENSDGKPIAAFYVLAQRAQPVKVLVGDVQLNFHNRVPSKSE